MSAVSSGKPGEKKLLRGTKNLLYFFYLRLLEIYGPQHWWPCKSGEAWEIIAGAVLTQNCAWKNVEKALNALEKASLTSPEKILSAHPEVLETAIRPAGFFRQKSVYLKSVAQCVLKYGEEFRGDPDPSRAREILLSVKGVGRETADSILLYAYGKPVFVIDAYTRRVAERHLGLNGSLPYDILRDVFLNALPENTALYQEYHALIVKLCKDSCRKSGCGSICGSLSAEQ